MFVTAKYESERKQMMKTVTELQDNIENEFQGSTEELNRVYQDFQVKVHEKEDQLEEVSDHE